MEDLKKELAIERKANKNSPGKTRKKNQAKNGDFLCASVFIDFFSRLI